MFFFPYSTELKLNKIPYVTYAVIILCIILFKFQYDNNKNTENAAIGYCSSVSIKSGKLASEYNCYRILSEIHTYYRNDEPLDEFISSNYLLYSSVKDEDQIIAKHYLEFSKDLEEGLDKNIMYYPDSWNPWKMFTSTIAHGDIWHIGFNLLFFFAFTPALEVLINNRMKFIRVLLMITLATGVTYSLASLGSRSIPTLGLSGVVMGMIGLSAYLMPKAKIRVFVWFILFIKTVYLPAWLLALWYIGWDSWELFNSGNSGGINLISHVSGGIAGYLLGMLWFKDRKSEYQEELDDEIEHRKYSRKNSAFQAITRKDNEEITNRRLIKEHTRDYEAKYSRIYNYVNSDRDSDALVLLLNDSYDLPLDVRMYEETFNRLKQWKPSKTLLCIGRLIIHLHMSKHQYDKAIQYTKECQAISNEFVLTTASEMLLLVQNAIKLEYYELAYYLLRNAEDRYTGSYDLTHCKLLEARVLWLYLDEPEKSKFLIKKLLESSPKTHRKEILNLALEMK